METKAVRMPAVLVLLVFSWVFLFCGMALAVSLVLIRPPMFPLWAMLSALAGCFLWGIVRVFADGCQMIFDIKGLCWEFWKSQRKDTDALLATLAEGIKAQKENMEALQSEVRAQTSGLREALRLSAAGAEEQSASLAERLDVLGALLKKLDERGEAGLARVATQIECVTTHIGKSLELSGQIRAGLEALGKAFALGDAARAEQAAAQAQRAAGIVQGLEILCQAVRESGADMLERLSALQQVMVSLDGKKELSVLEHDLRLLDDHLLGLHKSLAEWQKDVSEQGLGMRSALAEMRSAMEQMNCDSRDVNSNISQIRDFFSAIERHLSLNREL